MVGVKLEGRNSTGYQQYFDELRGLVEAAGGEIAAFMIQPRKRSESATYIGKGKIEELKHLIAELEPDLLVFDRELSPIQLRNLENLLEIRVIDRTMLILDIFSQRAQSREGKLQVELATLQYRLPRLRGTGIELSRLGAGIGTRGAGEQKLELDRRYIRSRIKEIKKQIAKLESTRELHRKLRHRRGVKTVSLAGYTNAGKSTLFNALCNIAHKSGSGQVQADSRLFQTLDTTTRRLQLSRDEYVLVTDTVGFIQELPPALVAAFHSTLEEAADADLLIHVADISDPEYLDKITVVEKALEELGADKSKIITVFNKADLLDSIPCSSDDILYISAKTGQGIHRLLEVIGPKLKG